MMSNHIIERMESEEKAYAEKVYDLQCKEHGYLPELNENCFIWFNPLTGGFVYDGSTVSNSLIQNMLLDKVIEFVGVNANSLLKYRLNEESQFAQRK